jgi:hypothetical protein
MTKLRIFNPEQPVEEPIAPPPFLVHYLVDQFMVMAAGQDPKYAEAIKEILGTFASFAELRMTLHPVVSSRSCPHPNGGKAYFLLIDGRHWVRVSAPLPTQPPIDPNAA